ncbi:MAG TPA: hypothetical protein VK071_06765 [Tissierellales bacterium]|nr:hypothetical protein [Tissierellales bacterium]
MLIICSENCIHEEEGLCTLKRISNSSKTPLKDCPHFEEKNKNKNRG